MNSRHKKYLMWTIVAGAISAFVGTVIKMLVTDQWPTLRPFVSTGWDWSVSVFTWLDQPVALPHWSVIGVSILMLVLVAILFWSLHLAGGKLIAAEAKIAELQTPSMPPRNDHQELVLAAVATYDTAGKDCHVKGLPPHISLTLLQVEGAIDVLEQRKLISVYYASSGKYVSLSVAGRAYVLDPDYSPPALPSRQVG